MRKFILILSYILVAVPLWAQEEPSSAFPPGRNLEAQHQVSQIHIEAFDVFDPRIPHYRSWPFRFLNAVHDRTNDSFIRRALLMREGDFIDDDLLAESERNLRKYSFLGDVKIEQKFVGPQKVDVYVHTEDQWTLQLDLSAGKSAGYSTYQFSIEESNFLGLGKTVQIAFNQNPERTTYGFLYFDPQFLNTRWNFESSYENASDGWRSTTDLIRPFYSLDTKWAYGVTWDSGTFTNKLPYKGKTVAEIDTDHRSGLFFMARSWGERYDKKRFGFLFGIDSLLYPRPVRIVLPDITSVKPIARLLHPIDREDYQYGALFQLDKQHFIEETYLDNFGKVEDLPDGTLLAATLTRAENQRPNTDFYQLNTLGQYSRQLNPNQYLSLQGQFSMRRHTDGNFSNIIFSSYAHYYLQSGRLRTGLITFPRQTLAVSLSGVLTHEVDPPFLISLGENEGLRGYRYRNFTGQNRFLFNVEERIFTPLDYRLFAIGVAAFLDAGYVWSSDEHLKFDDWPMSIGVGLRIALKKSQSSRVIRVDFAVPLQKDTSAFAATDQKGYSISISSGQIFNAIGELPKLFRLF